ncbi:MAG TPA: cytochrome C oxidase subunit III [Rhodopirellula baltica]|uniref:Cytochrome c oxidase, subunit III n=2 Tax=Rhodopirellula baltica TaxID=265606 RepID=L7CRJ1_RHOBT|nr:cytochrome c oxidase subunit 3 [Rhodopirellula baltica]ELP35701.1 cytochrome c oxidase, subunit III [Rhodopirellula baltica SWK14]HBE64750.1 cytochrome C oxidase subunit III [Rhodopirellula baltica]
MPVSVLPTDRRYRQGGWLFLGTLLVFFFSSLLLYGIYASSRLGDVQSSVPLPNSFLTSTVLLLCISGLVHWSTRSVRRSKRVLTASLLALSAIAAVAFMAIQYVAMLGLLGGPAMQGGTGKGVAGMVVVLAFLHALHVAGGVIALGIVSVRSMLGKYDHERHWPVDFAAQYWHFLDLVWLCMLATFVATTGGFSGITL